jgi:predicted acyltransferase
VAFDPEGLLSTLPAIANVTFGYAAGKWIQEKGNSYEGLTKLLLVGVTLIFLALCWNNFFPINKKLWTSSFVLYTIGLDCVIISAIIYVVDFLGKTKWTNFFTIFGKNPLFIYLVSEVGVIILYMIHPKPGVPLYNWLYQNIYKHLRDVFWFIFICNNIYAFSAGW